jgi:hypothetical protein
MLVYIEFEDVSNNMIDGIVFSTISGMYSKNRTSSILKLFKIRGTFDVTEDWVLPNVGTNRFMLRSNVLGSFANTWKICTDYDKEGFTIWCWLPTTTCPVPQQITYDLQDRLINMNHP